jgi:hypothetical protein
VLLEPLQSVHPEGIEPTDPDQIMIIPAGTAAATAVAIAVVTKAVVAI